DGLAGMRFPASGVSFPTKDEMADYLADYAARFELPVRTGVRVDGLSHDGDRYVVSPGTQRFEADNVVVATGASHTPKVPAFALDIDPSIVQLHSSEYRNTSQLREGGVLVVGVGNSGAEIAHEVVQTHPTWLSGKPTAQVPVRHGPRAARFAFPVVKFLGMHVLTMRTPIGRKVRPQFVSHATLPLRQPDQRGRVRLYAVRRADRARPAGAQRPVEARAVPRGRPDGRSRPRGRHPARVRAQPGHREAMGEGMVGVRQDLVVVRRP